MKRLILTAAIILATTSTPAFSQNTEQENDAAMAAVIYMIAQKRCNLTTGEDGKLRGMTISVIESHGHTWEQVVYGEKPMIRHFLKDNPVYEKATNNDPAAVRTVGRWRARHAWQEEIDLAERTVAGALPRSAPFGLSIYGPQT